MTLSEGFWQHRDIVDCPADSPADETLAAKALRSPHTTCLVAEFVVLVRIVCSVLLQPMHLWFLHDLVCHKFTVSVHT